MITPERVALDQLHESQRQTKQLERFNDELVFSIEKALEEKIAQKLTPQLSALVGAVEQLGAERSTDNTHALEKMVGEFTTALTERTGSEFDKVSATVERLGLTLEASVKAMDRTQQELGEALNRMLATISSSLSSTSTQFQTELAEAIGQVTDTLQEAMSTVSKQLIGASDAAADRISGSLTGFEQGVGKLEQTTAASTNLIQTADEMFQKFGGLADTLERTGTQFKEMLEPLREVVGTLKSSSDRMSTTLRDTAQLVEGVNRSVQSIETAQQKTSLAWDDYRQRFENIDQSLLKVFGQMDEGLARYTEQVRQFANDLDQHTSKAIQNLAAATGELDDAISHFLEGTVRTTQ